jgi:hypothetical protein
MPEMKWRLLALHPPPEVGKVDTSIRFTDILFGFVIKELFVRLANWELLPAYIQWHLIATSALVLGSWIGYRRSVNRSVYEVKFVNLPLMRFVVDQLMLVMYFRLAVLTQIDLSAAQPSLSTVTERTLLDILIVFVLYIAWDVLSIWIATCRDGDRRRYPKPGDPKTGDGLPTSDVEWSGFWISVVFAALIAILFLCTRAMSTGVLIIALTAALLVFYRVAKEIRTSYRHLRKTQSVPESS